MSFIVILIGCTCMQHKHAIRNSATRGSENSQPCISIFTNYSALLSAPTRSVGNQERTSHPKTPNAKKRGRRTPSFDRAQRLAFKTYPQILFASLWITFLQPQQLLDRTTFSSAAHGTPASAKTKPPPAQSGAQTRSARPTRRTAAQWWST